MRLLRIIYRRIRSIILNIIFLFPPWKIIKLTQNTQTPVTFGILFMQKILGFNRKVYWPVHFTSKINAPEFIICGIETCPGYMPGCYIQGYGGIEIGDYTQIGPNVGIISSNHDIYDNKKGVNKSPIYIGKYCWIGMNAVILPGVVLGDYTIVAAGAVVTKSFTNGYCIIGGVPAKVLRELDRSKCVSYENIKKYNGYIKHENFAEFSKKYLKYEKFKTS